MWRLLKSPPSVMREPTILASALHSSAPWSAKHAEATALKHRLEVLAKNLDTGEGEAVDYDWVQRFVAAHTRLVELGCRLEGGLVNVDAEVHRLQQVLVHPRVLGALQGEPDKGSVEPPASPGQVFHYGENDAQDCAEDLESTYDAFERFVEEVALALACTRFGAADALNAAERGSSGCGRLPANAAVRNEDLGSSCAFGTCCRAKPHRHSVWNTGVRLGKRWGCFLDLGGEPCGCSRQDWLLRLERRVLRRGWVMPQDFRLVQRIEFDFDVKSCGSVWAAPLWISPHPWDSPAATSGEVDFVEACPVGQMYTNFACGGHEEALLGCKKSQVGPLASICNDQKTALAVAADARMIGNADNLGGPKHFIMTFDGTTSFTSGGTLRTQICELGPTNCRNSAFYPDFLSRVDPTKGRGTSFPYTFLSDIWNGFGGDSGWTGCKARNNPNSQCEYAVRNIKVYTWSGAYRTLNVALGAEVIATSDQQKAVLLNAGTFATPELNTAHLSQGASNALAVIMRTAAAAALDSTPSEVGVHGVRIVTDAPGLEGGEVQGSQLLHFDIAFDLCGPPAAMEAAQRSKAAFERSLALTAAEQFEAFKVSTIRMLSLEPLFTTTAARETSTVELAAEEEEVPNQSLLQELWWLPWVCCIVLMLAAFGTYVWFRVRRKSARAELDFDGAISSRQMGADASAEWKWQSYLVRVVFAFDGRQMQGTALDLLENDLVQVEAEVDDAWLYGHTARDPDLVGFVPKNCVERLGTGAGAAAPQPPAPIPPFAPPTRGLLVRFTDESEQEMTMEVFAASRGWLYGCRPGGSPGWFAENALSKHDLKALRPPSGPRLAAAGTMGLEEGAPNCPEARPALARRSLTRQLTDAITSTFCTGSFPVS
ncbi:unnamed protein product [Effrenium voratum]|nr:unnamed protein product [Effrenium voratum]